MADNNKYTVEIATPATLSQQDLDDIANIVDNNVGHIEMDQMPKGMSEEETEAWSSGHSVEVTPEVDA